jgi:hypothetical protein
MWVEKSQVPVIVFTTIHRIEGTMYTYKDARILDELNAGAKDFIALTNVKIYPAESDNILYKSDFMALNKNHISHLLPQENFLNEEELF